MSTDVLLLDAVRERLDAHAFQHLQQPDYQVNPPASNNCKRLRGVPLIDLVDGQRYFRFNADLSQVFGLTSEAEWALTELKRAIAAAEPDSLQFPLTPGSVLVFDNYKVAHRRRCFDPGSDPEKTRWLRRCYGLGVTCNGRYVDRTSWPYLLN